MSQGYDWDTILLNIDWEQIDWRQFNWDDSEGKLASLRDETVHTIARAHRRDNADEFSPIHLEQLRRFNLRSSPVPATPQQPLIQEYFVDAALPYPRAVHAPAPPDCHYQGKTVRALTVSLELEVAVAAVAATVAPGDAHPMDPRPLLPDLAERHKYDMGLQQDLAQEIAVRVDSTVAGVVCVRRHEDEGGPFYMGDVRKAIDAELDLPGGSPTRTRLPPALENEAKRQIEKALDPDRRMLREATFTWENIATAVQLLRDTFYAEMLWDATSARRIGNRYEDLLKQEWFRAKRDPLHVDIPGMRPRWKAWSVEPLTAKGNPRQLAVPWHGMSRDAYTPRPAGVDDARTPFPEEHYKFFFGKVCSPVMPWGEWAWFVEQNAKVESVVFSLRQNLRVHRDLPALGLGTVVNVGHTQGFTLVQLKRLVTLWMAVEPMLAKLHRRHRYATDVHAASAGGGAPLMRSSKLGRAALYAADPNNNPFQSYVHVFPRVGTAVYERMIEKLMHFNVPTTWLLSLTRPQLIFIHAVWTYTDVSGLAEALEPPEGVRPPALRIRCTGLEETGASDADGKPQTVEFTGMQVSLHREHLFAWVGVCTAFVDLATNADKSARYKDLFESQDNVLGQLEVDDRYVEIFKQGFAHGGEYFEPPNSAVSWDDPFFGQLPM